MILGLGLALAGLLLGALGPRYLAHTSRPGVHPALGLTAWTATVLTMLAALAGGGFVLLLPDPAVPDGALGMARVCLDALMRGDAVPWAHALRLVVGATLLATVARVVVVGIRLARHDRRDRRRHLVVLGSVAHVEDDVLWIASPRPVAFSLGGREPRVVASSGIRDLPFEQSAAVLAHERAHLHGRHHLSVLLARTVARALPRVPVCREAAAAVPVLIELCADTVAARTCGFAALCDALVSVPDHSAPAPGLGIGLETTARLAWLRRRHHLRPWSGGRAARSVAALAAGLPVVLTVAAGAAVAVVACS